MEQPDGPFGRLVAPLRPRTIRGKILALALLATLVPAASTAALSYVRGRTALTETLEGELGGVASQAARELDLWIKERFYDLRVFVGSFQVIENLEVIDAGGPTSERATTQLTDYLTLLQERFPEYAGLFVLDANGEPVAASADAPVRPELPPEWLDPLRAGETRLGEPYWHEALSTVAVTAAVPVTSANGRFLGLLLATLTFEPLREALEGLAPGDEGRIDVLSAEDRVIVGSRPVSSLERTVSPEALERLAASRGLVEFPGDDGTDMVGILTPTPQAGWSALARVPSEEAYAPVARLTRSTTLLVTVLLLVVGTAAWSIGLVITRPLARLTEAARTVAEGDLSVDLPVAGRDEVSYLTGVFNGMVARLRGSAEALRAQNEELEKLSNTDVLTSLYNRRFVMGVLEQELERASRYERPLSVLMMDIDRFKEYNDAYGHQAGDDVLAGMGEVLRDATRESDVPARYGGEEFIVILPDCDLQGATDAAERIRARLSDEVFEGGAVTVSIGAAAHPGHGDSAMELIAAADVALYAAKEAGRDRVVAAGPGKKLPDGAPAGPERGKSRRRPRDG